MSGKLTIVVPMSRSAHGDEVAYHKINDISRFRLFLKESFDKFFDKNSVEEFIVIIPDHDLEYASGVLNLDGVKVMVDSDLFIEKEDAYFPGGWFKQQALKLKVAEFVKTDKYLILDADMFVTKPTSYDDLVINGKPKISYTPYGIHKVWWDSSAKFLGYPVRQYSEKDLLPGFTPQILLKDVVLELINKLSDQAEDGDWISHLASNALAGPNADFPQFNNPNWTEYCLYWTFLMNEYNIDDLYQDNYVLLGMGVWDHNQYKKLPDDYFDQVFDPNSDFYFSVIQSNIHGVSLEKLCTYLGKFVSGNIVRV